MKRPRLFLVPCALCLILFSCTTIDLYEKSVAIPGHAWKNSFKPSFQFTIKDSTHAYQPYLVLRHNDKYGFNNIYVNMYIQLPNGDTVKRITQDLSLADDQNGWKGTGMDDIYEHYLPLGDATSLGTGNYTFTIEQIMREDPLKNVLNVGLRIEKK